LTSDYVDRADEQADNSHQVFGFSLVSLY